MSLCEIAINSAAALTQLLDEKNIAVIAGQNTPLGNLVKEVYIDHNPVNQAGQYHVDTKRMIEVTAAADPILGFSEYNQIEEEQASVVANFLSSHIYAFKTQVAPMVDAYAERINARVSLLEGNPDNGAQVLTWVAPLPLQEPSLVEAFSKSQHVVVKDAPLDMKMAPAQEGEILEIIRTGNSALDASIADYFNAQDEGWLVSAWSRIFTAGEVAVPTMYGLNTYINGRGQGVAYALFVFLVGRKLWNNPPAGVDMELNRYTDRMVQYRDQAAQRLCRERELVERESSAGQLVRDVDTTKLGETIITVDQTMYRDFLKNGGTNEMLLANALLDAPLRGIKDILENKETLARKWTTHYALHKGMYEQKRLTAIRGAMLTEWDHMVRGMSDDDFPLEERAISRNLLIDYSRTIRIEDSECIKTLSLKAVCRSRFHQTHAEMFLLTMQRAMECNEGITPAEASDVAAIEYVSRWVASQMKLVGAKATSVF